MNQANGNNSLPYLPRGLVTPISIVLLAITGYIDYVTGVELGVGVFYVIPIAAVTWTAGRTPGLVMSAASAAVILAADLATPSTHSHPAIPFWNALVHLGFFVIIAVMLDKLKEAYERERRLSRTDPLTGAANKRSFFETAGLEIERSRRYGHPFTAAYLDLDNFKVVNDRFGHAAGDDLLKVLVRTVQENIRSIDTVARLGGDEFAVLLPELDEASAPLLFMRIRGKFNDAMQARDWPATVSIGLATFASPPETTDEMLKKVDALMYEAKEAGKDIVRHEVFGEGAAAPRA